MSDYLDRPVYADIADEARAAAQDTIDDRPTRREIESEDEFWERYGWTGGDR